MKAVAREFRIGELAKELALEKFVIRFWEKEFNIKSNRSKGGQRFYQQEDIEKFKLIKELLYAKGFTIAGAKQALCKPQEEQIIGSQKTSIDSAESLRKNLLQELQLIKEKLVTLKSHI